MVFQCFSCFSLSPEFFAYCLFFSFLQLRPPSGQPTWGVSFPRYAAKQTHGTDAAVRSLKALSEDEQHLGVLGLRRCCFFEGITSLRLREITRRCFFFLFRGLIWECFFFVFFSYGFCLGFWFYELLVIFYKDS